MDEQLAVGGDEHSAERKQIRQVLPGFEAGEILLLFHEWVTLDRQNLQRCGMLVEYRQLGLGNLKLVDDQRGFLDAANGGKLFGKDFFAERILRFIQRRSDVLIAFQHIGQGIAADQICFRFLAVQKIEMQTR